MFAHVSGKRKSFHFSAKSPKFLCGIWYTSSSNFLHGNFRAGLISAYIIKTLYFGRSEDPHTDDETFGLVISSSLTKP
nr:hypothetical protein CFP56_23655 [Quercus suber]